jgi:hypothetical protein
MNYARSKLRGIKKTMRPYPKGVTPRLFLSRVQSEHPPGFPLKACGNDGHREGSDFHAASCGRFNPLRLNDEV